MVSRPPSPPQGKDGRHTQSVGENHKNSKKPERVAGRLKKKKTSLE